MRLTNRFTRGLIALVVLAVVSAVTVAPAGAAGPEPRVRLDIIVHFDDGLVHFDGGETPLPNPADFGADQTISLSLDGVERGIDGGSGIGDYTYQSAFPYYNEAMVIQSLLQEAGLWCRVFDVDLCVIVQSNWSQEAIRWQRVPGETPVVYQELADLRALYDFHITTRSTTRLNRQ